MLRLLPVMPPLPDHCSSRAQPSAIASIRFSPTFLPAGPKTSHWPSQKSNWRCSLDSHALAGAGGSYWAPALTALSASTRATSALGAPGPVCARNFMTRD